jgi:hypothetical protein
VTLDQSTHKHAHTHTRTHTHTHIHAYTSSHALLIESNMNNQHTPPSSCKSHHAPDQAHTYIPLL